MKNLTLKQLRYFLALAAHGHFGRAADASAISQPALSMQIKELEEQFGTPLFERHARQIKLTAFGETVAERARKILHSVDELSDLAHSAQSGRLTRLRIGIIPTVAPYLLPTFIGNLTFRHPGIDIHVRETLTERLVRELGDGQLDMAIVALPVSETSFTEFPLFSEEFLLVRPLEDAGKPVPGSDTLSQMRLLLLEEGHCFRDQALAFCNPRSGLPKEGLDGSSLSTLVQMVGAGIGVTLVPEMAVDIETRTADVCVSRFKAPRPKRVIGMIWRKTNPLADQFVEIAEILKQAADKKSKPGQMHDRVRIGS